MVIGLILYRVKVEREKVVKVLAHHIPEGMRETDVCGWRKCGESMGILFTLVAVNDVATSLRAVELKVRDRLQQWLTPSLYQKMILIFRLFPDNNCLIGKEKEYTLLFYPDVMEQSPEARVMDGVKRCMNFTGSVSVLLLLAPLTLAIALMVKLTSKGPVLFRQERMGQYGKPFMLLKFRTMYADNDDSIHRSYVKSLIAGGNRSEGAESEGEVFKIKDDPRVTPLGRFLRKFSLDEVPQFINVLKGEMALVGPRPAIAYEVDSYAPWHRCRVLARKPGITGLWQVTGRSLTTFDEMVRLDLRYIRNCSIWLDIKLLLATPKAVIHGKGAY